MHAIPGNSSAGRRLLIVSNRLPFTVERRDDSTVLTPSGGGLATGLRPWHAQNNGVWIGWPGSEAKLDDGAREHLEAMFRAHHVVPVHLSRDHVERYYQGFSNRVIWPLFHYLLDRVPVEAAAWDAYCEANARFADAVVREFRPGDRIWIHDYQLMLVPGLVRARLPDAPIGFFLHIPLPSSEVFRALPWRRQLLEGMLGADLIGFHTYAYMRHFIASLLHVSGIEAEIDRVRVGDREVVLGAFPMGVDAKEFDRRSTLDSVQAQVDEIRRECGRRQLIVGVDRLDYTKGIPRRLQAVERLLDQNPELRDRVRYIQIAVPTRNGVDAYQRFKREIEQTIGRINGKYGSLHAAPVHYVHRSISDEQLSALYRAADVMLVTPLRDGMNLVAKEFVASRGDESGVLMLSEFAGAAAELDGALVVNPYDVDEMSVQLRRALAMGAPERKARMRQLRQRVFSYDVYSWAQDFLAHLPDRRGAVAGPARPALLTAIEEARLAGPVRILLDYDGTLVPLAKSPELATPDADLLWLLGALAATPGLSIEVVSGRPKDWLDQTLGHLNIRLWAEHGFWRREAGAPWQPVAQVDPRWRDRVLPILERFTAATPGSRLELKSTSIAWHFRGAQRTFGATQAHELRMLLGDALSNQPLEVLEGHKVVEIRLRGISKAVVGHSGAVTTPEVIVAFGDDRTDEDLFRSLPRGSVTVSVGQTIAGARFMVPSYRGVRRILRGLLPPSAGEPELEPLAEGDHTMEVV